MDENTILVVVIGIAGLAIGIIVGFTFGFETGKMHKEENYEDFLNQKEDK
jgi:hypothetical protein